MTNMKPGILRAILLATLSLLAVAGCSPEAGSSQPAPADSTAKGVGVLEASTGAYEFTPMTCAVHKEDGVDDIEVAGPGTAPDGEEFYFELTSTGNELTVSLGATGPFDSADRRLRAGRYVSQEFAIDVSGGRMTVRHLVLVDENRQPVDDDATLTIDCGG